MRKNSFFQEIRDAKGHKVCEVDAKTKTIMIFNKGASTKITFTDDDFQVDREIIK